VLETFQTINRTRDLVLVDQRGTGQSNPIECANFADIELDVEPTDEAVAHIINTCLAGLEADPTLYTTDIAMADLDEVRAALGYDQINLYGVSYGTRAALDYVRLYPAQVRAIILDAVTAPELVLFLTAPRDGQRALTMVFDRCSADPACRDQFPNLRAEFDALFASLAEPQPATVIHPLSGEAIELTLTQDVLMQSLFNALYSADIVALLPLLIHQASATGDIAPLVAQALVVSEGIGIYYGLLYSVTCAEDAPLIVLEEAERIQAETQFPLMAASFLQVCAHWPRGMVSADFRQPVRSDVPVLLLSGAADPITPPHYAEQVAETLPNSLHLVIPGYGHGVSAVGCMPDIAARFIASGTVAGLATGCLAEVQPPPFFVNHSGPQP
jgi:pimeloyl-ACP methyl ester carboxylesterase